jgi:DNA (cytosine-5)-methyltransferase 1
VKLLDLFCCAGGAAVGYNHAGWDVIGVDINPQPRYPFFFIQMDAIAALDTMNLRSVDAIHASPPCQAHSDLQKQSKLHYEDFIGPVRERLQAIGLPYVIENVEGAPLIDPVMLCGAMFSDLRTYRHRLFETNWPLVPPPHPKHTALTHTFDKRKRHHGAPVTDDTFFQVTGGGNATVAQKSRALGIDWMTGKELNEAIPPAYTHYIGVQLAAHLRAAA